MSRRLITLSSDNINFNSCILQSDLKTNLYLCWFFYSSNEKIGDDKCSAVGCPGTDLTDLNTYFSQHVLEKSNASNYFNVYVAGFTFAPQGTPMVKPSNMTSNMTNSSGTGPGNKQQETPTETTVWYSNEVNMAVKTTHRYEFENDFVMPRLNVVIREINMLSIDQAYRYTENGKRELVFHFVTLLSNSKIKPSK